MKGNEALAGKRVNKRQKGGATYNRNAILTDNTDAKLRQFVFLNKLKGQKPDSYSSVIAAALDEYLGARLTDADREIIEHLQKKG